MLGVVVGDALTITVAAVVGGAVAVVVEAVLAHFPLSEANAGANREGLRRRGHATPVVASGAAAVLRAGLAANAAPFVHPNAQGRRAVFRFGASFSQVLPSAARRRGGVRTAANEHEQRQERAPEHAAKKLDDHGFIALKPQRV
jgi:hypothetical protein